MSDSQLISFDDALAEYGLDPKILRQWIADGRLRVYRSQQTVKFKRHDLDSLRGNGSPSAASRAAPPGETPAHPPPRPPAVSDEEPTEDTVLAPSLDAVSKADAPPGPSREPREAEATSWVAPVAGPAEDPDAVRFECSCGRRMKAKARFIGQSVTCSRCGRPVEIPPKSEASAQPPATRNGVVAEPLTHRAPRPEPSRPAPEPKVESAAPPPRPESPRPAPGPKAESPPPPPPAVPHAEPPRTDARLDHIESVQDDLGRQLEQIRAQMETLRKEHEQVRFDIARLYDLVSRLKPESAVPPEPSTEILQRLRLREGPGRRTP